MPLERTGGRRNDAVYVKVHPYFINVERSPGRLLRRLYTRSAALGIVDWNTPLVSMRLRSSALYLMSSIGLKCAAARALAAFGKCPGSVSLPDRGDIAMFCFPDCVRLFDLDRWRITNICTSESPDARRRLARMLDFQRKIGESGVAPKIYDGDHAGDTYIEELCDAARLKSRKWWRKEIFDTVNTAARVIQRSSPGQVKRLGDRVEELRDCVAVLPQTGRESACRDWLLGQVDVACGGVDSHEEMELFLSHGDLARRNILVRRDGSIVCIDWHTVDYRIKDYDIYNYHFSIAQDGAAESLPESAVFEYLQEALGRPAGSEAIHAVRRFRLDFFLTRLKCFLLPGAGDESRASRVLEQLRKYAGCLARYEDYCNTAQ